MVAVARRNHDIGWVTPAPMWNSFGALTADVDREEFLRPAILRFAHDAFMEELFAALAYHPDRLREWRAAFETWEKPMPAAPTADEPPRHQPISKLSMRLNRLSAKRGALPGAAGPADSSLPATLDRAPPKPLKLYQPVQQRHYLVTASLVCRRPGLPDRRIDAGKQERAAFVLRRIILADGDTLPSSDPRNWDEYAFVETEAGPRWQQLKSVPGDPADTLLPGEERLPLFSIGFNEESGRARRMFGGLIPVGRREAYVGAGVRASPPGGDPAAGDPAAATDSGADPLLMLFRMRVTGPWSELVQQSLDEMNRFDKKPASFLGEDSPGTPDPESVNRAREQAQTVSWYALLDLERFLHDHLPDVWEVLEGSRTRSDLDRDAEEELLVWLESVTLDATLRTELGAKASQSNLLQVLTLLAQTGSIGDGLERVEIPYDRAAPHADWPGFLFPLADIGARGPFPFSVDGTNLAASRDQVMEQVDAAFEELAGRLSRALPVRRASARPEIHIPSNPNVDTRTAWFAIRCVYERPNCGPFNPPAVSEPTEPFQMASFFDPEAPARPVRIPMPLDISPAGLRKFSKGATLQISDMLCGQLKRIRKMTLGDLVLSVLPWPFHKDLPEPGAGGPCKDGQSNPFGMFCSLSIPIVTLCALVLMIIIVSLFDIFFRWLPYLFVCLPIPGLKGKRQ